MPEPDPAPVQMGADIQLFSETFLDSRLRGNDMFAIKKCLCLSVWVRGY
jgi:hypothetical protein